MSRGNLKAPCGSQRMVGQVVDLFGVTRVLEMYMLYLFFSSQTFSLAGHLPFNPPETSVLAMSVTS